MSTALPALVARLNDSHFHSQIAVDQVTRAVGTEDVQGFVVLTDMYMDREGDVRRDLDVYVLTGTRLLNWSAHEDAPVEGQHPDASDHAVDVLTLHTRLHTVPLRSILDTRVVQSFPDPEQYVAGQGPTTITGFIVMREMEGLAAEPVDCGEEECTGVHGMAGELSHASLHIRVSTLAQGEQAVEDAQTFFDALPRALAALR